MEEEIVNILYGKETWDVYKEFKKIEESIDNSDELYKFFNEFKTMILNDKSAIRVRGFRIICKLSKYDKDNKIDECIDTLLNVFDDELPTAIRQCLNAVNTLILYKPILKNKIKSRIMKINYLKYKDTMSPLIKKDIDNILSRY